MVSIRLLLRKTERNENLLAFRSAKKKETHTCSQLQV